MAERYYECMFVLDSGRYAQNPSGTEANVKELLDRCNADVLASAPWQDGKLPYPIQGKKKGLHYLVYMKMDGSQVAELDRICKLNDLVLRHMVIDHTDHPALFNEKLVPSLQDHVAGADAEEKSSS
ncbi:MAG: 30S ribosomal protein S6 [Planctomycetota bacterium]|nr:MAG: 30S ribosomal protein S6 [Planctomycetota bacterium]REK38928.1 MAG: 30S ribosomal protein S6 [Planctomycetota bacterium]